MQTLMFLAMMLAGMSMPAPPDSAPPPGYWASQEAAMQTVASTTPDQYQAVASTTPYQYVDGVDVPSKPLNTPKVRGVPAPQPQIQAKPQQQDQQPIVVNVYIQAPPAQQQAAPGRGGAYDDAYYNPVIPSGSRIAPDYAQFYPAADYGYYGYDGYAPYSPPPVLRYRVGWRSYVPYYGGPFADNYTRFYSRYWDKAYGLWNGGYGWNRGYWNYNGDRNWNRGGGYRGGGGDHAWGGGSSYRGGRGGDRVGIRSGGGREGFANGGGRGGFSGSRGGSGGPRGGGRR